MTTDQTLSYRKNVLLAIALTCIGYAFYNISDAALKMMAGKFHFSQFFVINGVATLIFMTIYGTVTEGFKSLRTSIPGKFMLRAGMSQICALCNIAAFPHIHLTSFYTLVFTSPFWVALLSAYFLKDKLDTRRLLVILFGFSVVLFIFRPGSGAFNVWSLLILASAFVYSCQMVLVRSFGTKESRPFMIMCGAIMSIVIGLPFLPEHFIMPTPYEWGLFFIMSFVGTIGLLCITYAFQAAPAASVVAPYHYTQIVWGALIGYFLFNEAPEMQMMIGATLIILAGLYLLHSETRRKQPVIEETAV